MCLTPGLLWDYMLRRHQRRKIFLQIKKRTITIYTRFFLNLVKNLCPSTLDNWIQDPRPQYYELNKWPSSIISLRPNKIVFSNAHYPPCNPAETFMKLLENWKLLPMKIRANIMQWVATYQIITTTERKSQSGRGQHCLVLIINHRNHSIKMTMSA